MSSILHNDQEVELSNAISSFFVSFYIGNLLRKCNVGTNERHRNHDRAS